MTEYTFHAIEAADIGDGEVRRIVIGGREIALYRIDGSFYATDDGCTHEHASLADGFVDGTAIECPLHGGRFDIKTGRAIAPPCTIDLRTFPVKLDGGRVLVGLCRSAKLGACR